LRRWEEYIHSIKIIYAMTYVLTALISAVLSGGVMFFIGANNPPAKILQKLLNKHKDSIDKIMKS